MSAAGRKLALRSRNATESAAQARKALPNWLLQFTG